MEHTQTAPVCQPAEETQQTGGDTVTFRPRSGIIRVGDVKLRLGMTPKTVHNAFGQPERVLKEDKAYKSFCELYHDGGIMLRYHDLHSACPHFEDMILCEVMITEKCGRQVKADGLAIFDDEQLAELKSRYKHIESLKWKATAFPTLGVLLLSRGEKKPGGSAARSRMAFLCSEDVMRFYISTIGEWG